MLVTKMLEMLVTYVRNSRPISHGTLINTVVPVDLDVGAFDKEGRTKQK